MKFRKLLTLLPVLALCACGAKSLTQEEAIQRANDILAAQEEITEIPATFTLAQTIESKETTNGVTQSGKTAANVAVAENYYHSKTTYSAKTEEGSVDQGLELYVYIKGSVLVAAMKTTLNGEVTAIKQETQIPEGAELPTTDDYLEMAQELDGISIELSMFLMDSYLESLEASYGSLDVGASLSASSSGEGHLRIDVKMSVTEGIYELSQAGHYEWKNNLFSSLSVTGVQKAKTEDLNYSSESKIELKINYNAKVTYPDLSQYTEYVEE